MPLWKTNLNNSLTFYRKIHNTYINIINRYQKIGKTYKYTIKTQKQKWKENNIKNLETLTNHQKQFWQNLKTFRRKLKSELVDGARKGFNAFLNFLLLKDTKLLRTTRKPETPSAWENSILDSPFGAEEVSKGIE